MTAGAGAARSGVTVRTAVVDDVDAVVDVGRVSSRHATAGLIEDEIAELMLAKWWTPRACLPSIEAGRTLVAELDGRIVGMLASGPHRGAHVVWKLYVLPEAQGRGAGAALVRTVIEWADAVGDDVYVSYHDGTPRVGAFLARLGFAYAEREKQSGLPDLIWTRRPARGDQP